MNDNTERDPRLYAIPDTHGHAKGEHKPYAEERPLPLTARMLFLWFYHACRRGYPRFLMVADHMNYLTFEDPAAVNLVRRALKLAQAGDLYGAAETANVEVAHAAAVSEGLRRGMRYSIGAEIDNDPRSRPDAQNIVDAMRPDAMIRSVHFIPITHPVHGENWQWPFDNPEFQDLFDVVGVEKTWETYVATLVDVIERLPGHIVGHFYVPAVFGHWPDDAKLDTYENRVLDAVEARGMAVEFNTRFLYREHSDAEKQRYLEANMRLLRKARDRGIGITVGSDAHSPKDQAGAFPEVLRVLDELEINEIVFPMAGLLRRVALRVVREPEPEPVPEPEPQKPAAAAEEAGVAKPVRKARPAAKPTRAAETSPARPSERPEQPVATAEPPVAEPPPSAAVEGSKASEDGVIAPSGLTRKPAKGSGRAEAVSQASGTPAKAAPPPKPAPAKPVAAKAATPKSVAAKPAAKNTSHAKPVAKAKPAGNARSAGNVKPAAKKGASAKAAAKKAAPAKKAVKKTAPARGGAKKAAPAKKAASAKKPAPKRTVAARPTPKKAAPKKATAKKATARKAPGAKKTTAKKTATKRR